MKKEVEQIKKIKSIKSIKKIEVPEILQLEELTYHNCHWPIGDPRDPEFGFCGKDVAPNSRYCQRHTWMAYQPGSGQGIRKIPSNKEQKLKK